MPPSNSKRAKAARAIRNRAIANLRMVRMKKRKYNKYPNVYHFKEYCQITSLTIPSGTTTYGTLKYKLNDLDNIVAYRNLFDLYRIRGVKVTLIPLANTADTDNLNTVGQQGQAPMLYVAPNRDPSVNPPVSVADVLNDDGCKIVRFLKPASFYLKDPKVQLLSVDRSQIIPFQFNVNIQPWLTTGSPANQGYDQSDLFHWGHRWAITNNAPGEMVVQVYVKYYLDFKEQD